MQRFGFFFRAISVFALVLVFATPVLAEQVRFDDARELLNAAPAVAGTVKSTVPAGRPVVVSFFASWCPPCTVEFKHLNDVRAKLTAEQVSIIAVNAFENWGGEQHPSRMKRFLARTKPAFPLVQANAKILKAFGNVTRIPTVVVFNADGKEVWRFVHEEGSSKRFTTTTEIFAALGVGQD